MYNPYENNHTTNQGNAQWDAPKQEPTTYWNGSSYHSGPAPGPSQPVQTPPPKKPKKGLETWHKIMIGVLACLVVSVGSSGTFAALISTGVIPVAGAAGQANPAPSSQTSAGNPGSASSSQTIQMSSSPQGEMLKQDVAKKVIPSVVCIETSFTSSGFLFGQSQENSGSGSGVIATSDGYIITNAHVVDGASSVKVVLSDNSSYEAKIVGVDTATDLALIKIDATNLQAAEFGSSADLRVADTVMAVGNPGGLAFQSSVAIGYISALNRDISTDTAANMKCIQTDAAINPGNSGGALVNMQGQVIGINSSKLVSTSYEGMGFAIPIDDALPIINDLREYGYVKSRGVLMISGQYVDQITARWNGLSATGFYVAKINADSVKAEGLKEGDIIMSVDGTDITSLNVMSSVLQGKKPGDSVTLEVARGRASHTLKVTLVERTEEAS